MNITQFVDAIRDQKRGFKFGKPWRYSKKSLFAVVPITRKSKIEREYIALSEAKKVKIEDSGNIDKVFVTNNEKKPLFIRAGEVFRGETQERTAIISHMVAPKEKAEVRVACVHRTKGISGGTIMRTSKKMTYAPISVEKGLYDGNDQVNIWGSVSAFSMQASVSMSSSMGPSKSPDVDYSPAIPDDLTESMEAMTKSMNDVIKAVPKTKDQVGLVLISADGVESIECFDLPDSWTAVREGILGKESETFSKYLEDQDSIFEFKSEKVNRIAKKVFRLKFKRKELYRDKEVRVVGLTAKNYIGEVMLFRGKVIHLALTRKTN